MFHSARPYRLAAAVLAALPLFTLLSAARAQDRPASEIPPAPPVEVPREVRGVWVVRTDLTSRQAVTRVVQHARKNGLNTLFVQCRGRGDAYYCGGLEPRARSLAKCAADFDPLAQILQEGKAAGLKVHAWVNACYVWSEKKSPGAEHLVNAHRDWLAVDRNGRRCTVGDPEVFICPSNPEARAHLAAVCRDLSRRYELDGLQLDYIRYANGNLCYCAPCLQRFEAYVTPKLTPAKIATARAKGRLGLVQASPWSWKQFRRDQVTTLVREIRAAVKAERPSAILSAAVIPWGPFSPDFTKSEAYNTVGQDWYGWIREGLVDAVCPMTYQASLAGFKSWVNGVRRDHPNFPVWFGIGAYLFGPDGAAAKVQATRQAGAPGWVLFSYTAVTKGGANDAYLRDLKARVLPRETASR